MYIVKPYFTLNMQFIRYNTMVKRQYISIQFQILQMITVASIVKLRLDQFPFHPFILQVLSVLLPEKIRRLKLKASFR